MSRSFCHDCLSCKHKPELFLELEDAKKHSGGQKQKWNLEQEKRRLFIH